MTQRGYYFGAGPATLPEAIIKSAQSELLNWHDTGLSILELGHRTELFQALLANAKTLLRRLLNIPSNYQVLFLGGPARSQFAMVPMNLLSAEQNKALYAVSGLWSKLAFEEAKRMGVAADLLNTSNISTDTAYVYYTPNETIDGVYTACPPIEDIPIVADMTSCILSEVIDVSQFGLIFAGAQKNIGPAGLTTVIVRDDLLAIPPREALPCIFDYRVHAKNDSLYATPPVFQCEMAHRMFEWLESQGGVEAFEKESAEKSQMLYDYIDASPHYECLVEASMRSKINVCFSLTDESKLTQFLEEAVLAGLTGLKGHRVKGGLRASLYNAMPKAGVSALIAFMDDFVK